MYIYRTNCPKLMLVGAGPWLCRCESANMVMGFSLHIIHLFFVCISFAIIKPVVINGIVLL